MQINIEYFKQDLLRVRHDMAKKGRVIQWTNPKKLAGGSAGRIYRKVIKELILFYWEKEAQKRYEKENK